MQIQRGQIPIDELQNEFAQLQIDYPDVLVIELGCIVTFTHEYEFDARFYKVAEVCESIKESGGWTVLEFYGADRDPYAFEAKIVVMYDPFEVFVNTQLDLDFLDNHAD